MSVMPPPIADDERASPSRSRCHHERFGAGSAAWTGSAAGFGTAGSLSRPNRRESRPGFFGVWSLIGPR